ncbi:unnamed protein product, partial [Adineta ricciae]
MPVSEMKRPATTPKQSSTTQPEVLEDLNITIRIKLKYPKVNEFVDKLNQPNETLTIHGKPISVLHLYALRSTSKPIDMSNQTERLVYRPNLLIRKNDKFGPWNFNRLLNLIELDYRPGTKGNQFPKLWYTTTSTSVSVTIIPYAEP